MFAGLGFPTIALIGIFAVLIALPMSWLCDHFGIAKFWAVASVFPPIAMLLFWVIAYEARKKDVKGAI